MKPNKEPISADFSEVKRNLDPAFSYVVFVREAGSWRDKGFVEIMEVFSRLKEKVISSEIYMDQSASEFMLIVTIEPEESEMIMQEILEAGLPEDIVFYLYGSSR